MRTLFLTSATADGTAILRGHPSHAKVICRANMAKAVPSFLSYFKTLRTGRAPGIEPVSSRSAVKRSTDWANPAGVIYLFIYLLLISFAKRPGSLTEQAPIRGPGVDLPDLKTFYQFFLIPCIEKHKTGMLLHRHPGPKNFGRIYGEPMYFFIGFMLARMLETGMDNTGSQNQPE